jgi:uncharacterized membrane protein
MKILKIIGIALLAIVAILLIVAAFVRKEYAVEKSIVINKPHAEVYNYVRLLKNQNQYSKWAKLDPVMRTSFRGTDGTVGFVSAWDSDSSDVGKGEQEIKSIQEGMRIDYEIRFIKPFESTSTAYLTVLPDGENQTKVNWGFNGKMPYPMNLMIVFMDLENMIGADLDEGLHNLKTLQEKAPAAN